MQESLEARQLLDVQLLNATNTCYINSMVLGLLWMYLEAGMLHAVPAPFRQVLSRATNSAIFALRFYMVGWPKPHCQHDWVEFTAFLLPQLPGGSFRGYWSGIRLDSGRVRITDRGRLSHAIALSTPVKPTMSVQQLLYNWQAQEACYALDGEADMILLQLPRFATVRRNVQKLTQPYDIPHLLQVPIHLREQPGDVRWATYRAVICVQHLGATTQAGHYQTVMLSSQGSWITDDAAQAQPLYQSQIQQLQCNMYVVGCVRD